MTSSTHMEPKASQNRLRIIKTSVKFLSSTNSHIHDRKGKDFLDGFLLVEKPEDCKEAILESLDLRKVVTEDLTLFTHLTFLDLGDNNLRLEFFGSLPCLKELHLQCNGITTIDNLQGFPELKMLDLSYNKLTPSAIVHLSTLTKLHHLDLTYNELTELPPMQAFTSLEILNLEKNLLQIDVFGKLGSLHRLRELNLAYNKLCTIPNNITGLSSLQLLSLVNNSLSSEALLNLKQLDSLKHILVWGNPIKKKALDDSNLAFVISEPVIGAKRPLAQHVKRVSIPDLPLLAPVTPKVKEEDDVQPELPAQEEEGVTFSKFFLTEFDDDMQLSRRVKVDVKPDEKAAEPERGVYDILYASDSDEEEGLPSGGIQAAVNALRIALKHPSHRIAPRLHANNATFSSRKMRLAPFSSFDDTAKQSLRLNQLESIRSKLSTSTQEDTEMSHLLKGILSNNFEDTRAQLQASFQHYEKLAKLQHAEEEVENLIRKQEEDAKNPFRIKTTFLV